MSAPEREASTASVASLLVPFLSPRRAERRHRVLPLYDLRTISVPIGLFVGDRDTLIDAQRLLALMPPLSAPSPTPARRAGEFLRQRAPGARAALVVEGADSGAMGAGAMGAGAAAARAARSAPASPAPRLARAPPAAAAPVVGAEELDEAARSASGSGGGASPVEAAAPFAPLDLSSSSAVLSSPLLPSSSASPLALGGERALRALPPLPPLPLLPPLPPLLPRRPAASDAGVVWERHRPFLFREPLFEARAASGRSSDRKHVSTN